MLSTPSKNIENIAIHLHFEQKNKNPKYESPSKPKIISAANHNCERNLSPWNRKKDEQNARRISINEDPNQVTVNFSEKETDLNSSTTKKMTDFLEKIHFTNKKKNSSERKIPPHKLNKFEESKNLGEKTISDRLADLTSEEIKQIIVYKKNHKENEVSTKKKLNLKGKKNEFTEKKLTSIQNFYDPYQNKPKISRKLIKYQLKLHDELTYTTRLNDSTASYGDFQTTWRKNTAPEKVHKRNFSMPDHELNQFKNFKTENEKSMVRTFFETKTSNFSRALKTEPTERNESIRDDPEREHAEKSEEKSSPFELTYVTPSGQAIKRIKHQYKKSRKMKTEQNYYKSEHSKSEIETLKRERNFYLYQTFLNYKSKKDSSGMNITKTLGFNFHNQQTFNQSLQKVWLNSKN